MTRNGFLYTALILALLGWGIWKRANDNAHKHPRNSERNALPRVRHWNHGLWRLRTEELTRHIGST